MAMKNLLPLLAAALLLTGCRTVQGPGLSLVNVQFAGVTAFESTAQFTLRITNPSPEPLRLTGGTHKIYLNGIYVGEGLSNEAVTLDRLSTVTQVVTVHLSNLRLATRIRPLVESRTFEYRIESVFYAAGAGRSGSTSEGRLDLNEFQPASGTFPR
jgi:LEA14-like dessication related protein